jgi:hypothetical protein
MLNTALFDLKLSPRGTKSSEQDELKLKQEVMRTRIEKRVKLEGSFSIMRNIPKALEERSRSAPGIIIRVSHTDVDPRQGPECRFCQRIICTCPDSKKRWMIRLQYETNTRVLERLTQLENTPVNVRVLLSKAIAKKFLEQGKYDLVISCIEKLAKFRVTKKRRKAIDKILKRLFNETPVCKDVKFIDKAFAPLDKYDPYLSDEWLFMKLFYFRIRFNVTHNRHRLECHLSELYDQYASRTISESNRAKGWYTLMAFEYELMGFTRHLESHFRKCKGVERLLEFQHSRVRAHIAEISGFVQWKDQRDLEKCRTTFYDSYKYFSKGGNIKAALCCMAYSIAVYNFEAKKKVCDGSITVLMAWITSNVIEDSLAMMEENNQTVDDQIPMITSVKQRVIEILRKETQERGTEEKYCIIRNHFNDVDIITPNPCEEQWIICLSY